MDERFLAEIGRLNAVAVNAKRIWEIHRGMPPGGFYNARRYRGYDLTLRDETDSEKKVIWARMPHVALKKARRHLQGEARRSDA